MDTEGTAARETTQGLAPDIACTLAPKRLAGQADRWRQLLQAAGLGRTETADGLELRFRDEPAAERELRDLVAVERACCAWARWEVQRADGALVLHASSTPDGAAALHAMFGPEGAARDSGRP